MATEIKDAPLTVGEVQKLHLDYQKRGLTHDGATKAVTKALTGRVVLMEDGTEVAAGDVQFTTPEPQGEAMEGEEDEEAKAGAEPKSGATLTIKVKKLVDEAVKTAVAAIQPKGNKARDIAARDGEATQTGSAKTLSLAIPATVKRYRVKSFKGDVIHPEYGVKMSPEIRALRFGMFALARLGQDMPGRFRFEQAEKYCDEHGINWKASVHTSTSNSLGGYLVADEFGNDMIDLREQFGVVRQLFKVRPMSSDTRTDPRRASGLTAYFVNDTAAGTESNKGWDQVSLVAKNLMALSRYTAQLDADAVISIGDDLASEIAYAFANKEDDCGFNGTGTSTYGGIYGVRPRLAAVGTAGVTTQATGNTWAAIVMADMLGTASKLPVYADASKVWVCHSAFYYQVMLRLELAQGGSTATEAKDGLPGRPMFLGTPVVFSQVFPAATAVATLSAVLGNFQLGASFGDRQQLSIAFSDQATIGGESLFERNEVGIRGVERFDINVHDVGSASVAGPIVGIKTGA